MTLYAAIRTADLASTTDLTRSREGINQRGPDGLTPLMIASGLGQSQVVRLLLDAGADVHAIEPRMGATALHKAAQSGSVDVVAMLHEHGAFIDQQSPVLGNTALMDAVLHKQEGAVQLLLDRGARTTIQSHWQQTALDLARQDGLDGIARRIELRNASDAERIRALTLMAAITAGDIKEVERLVAIGLPVDQRAPIVGSLDDSYTPLGLAVREGRADMVHVLLKAGADPLQSTGLMGGTAIHEAAFFGHADMLRVMTAAPGHPGDSVPELDAQGPYNGLTALHDAVWHGHLAAAQVLVEAGARVDLKTHAGLTPRELAQIYGYEDLVRSLAKAEQA